MRASRRMAIIGGAQAPVVVEYTGNYADEIVTMNGVQYRLLTFTSSGTLSLSRPTTVDLCVVGAGVGPPTKTALGHTAGCAGGKLINQTNTANFTGAVVTIGASSWLAAASSIGALSSGTSGGGSSSDICNGGTGAGGSGGYAYNRGMGDGLSKYPFGETSFFSPHSGGGGGGAYYDRDGGTFRGSGGAGGTNGGNGGYGTNSSSNPGAGGALGGGIGGNATSTYSNNGGGNASFYGSGGGCGGFYVSTTGVETEGPHGYGYQGVAYMRISL